MQNICFIAPFEIVTKTNLGTIEKTKTNFTLISHHDSSQPLSHDVIAADDLVRPQQVIDGGEAAAAAAVLAAAPLLLQAAVIVVGRLAHCVVVVVAVLHLDGRGGLAGATAG